MIAPFQVSPEVLARRSEVLQQPRKYLSDSNIAALERLSMFRATRVRGGYVAGGKTIRLETVRKFRALDLISEDGGGAPPNWRGKAILAKLNGS